MLHTKRALGGVFVAPIIWPPRPAGTCSARAATPPKR